MLNGAETAVTYIGCACNVVCLPHTCVAGSGDGTLEQWGSEAVTQKATAKVSDMCRSVQSEC